MMVNDLVNLQDPILPTPENPTMPADTLVGLQDLQEPIVMTSAIGPSPQEPIITSSATSSPPERVRLQEPIATTSAITPPLERVRLQVPIITSLVFTPSLEQVCFITEPFASSFPCAVIILYLLSGSEPLGTALIQPCIHWLWPY
jgi:hypothetical protein